MIKKYYNKKRVSYAEGTCPHCGKRLVNRIKKETKEPFVGCSGFPSCTYIVPIQKDKAYYVSESFPNGWKPNYSNDLYYVFEKCDSKVEIKYLFGAAYYLDTNSHVKERSKGIRLYKDDVFYEGKYYPAVKFEYPFNYWGGGVAPSAMAFVPQLEFAGKFHHDFGVFFSDKLSATGKDWEFMLAVEVDYHSDHIFKPGKDKYRDSLVTYPVLRLQESTDSPLDWFIKVKMVWNNIKDPYFE